MAGIERVDCGIAGSVGDALTDNGTLVERLSPEAANRGLQRALEVGNVVVLVHQHCTWEIPEKHEEFLVAPC